VRVRFDFTSSHRAAIAAALPAGMTLHDVDYAFLEVLFGDYLHLRQRRAAYPFAQRKRFWAKVRKMAQGETALLAAADSYEAWHETARCFRGQRNPHRDLLYDGVLLVWTENGGVLRFSTSRTGVPAGPLVRFFLACITPVMGAETPSVRSIPGIVRRERRYVFLTPKI
jgi:hypothetical protein